MVAGLRPRVGKKNVSAVERGVRQTRDDIARVALVQADVLGVGLFYVAQTRGDTVEEGLDADEALLRMRRRLRDQMLAAAKADF